MKRRLQFAAIHLLITATIAASLSAMVTLVWYPDGYAKLMGGFKLIAIIVACDLVFGPSLSAMVYDPSKSLLARWVDYSTLALVRIAALSYGLSVVIDSRPAFTVFAIDRFNIVAAYEVQKADLNDKTGSAAHAVPWDGPVWVSLRLPSEPTERSKLMELELGGTELHTLPRFFAPYSAQQVLEKSQGLDVLVGRHPEAAEPSRRVVANARLREGDVVWLPVQTRLGFSTALLRRTDGGLVGFVAIDPY